MFILQEIYNSPIVFTSANLASDGLIIEDKKIKDIFLNKVDFCLLHNLEFKNEVDFSISFYEVENFIMLRRAGSYVGNYINIPYKVFRGICVGPELESSIALAVDNKVFISTRMGYLVNKSVFDTFEKNFFKLLNLFNIDLDYIVADLHPYYLSTTFAKEFSDDLLLGWDSDPAIRNIAGLVERYPDFAIKGVELRKFGQTIIELVAGARINPKWIVPGGIAQSLTAGKKDKILKDIPKVKNNVIFALNYFKDYIQKNKDFIEQYANFDTCYLGLIKDDESIEHYDGKIRIIDKDGNFINEFNDMEYINYIGEYIEDWSYLKFPYYKPLGYDKGVYRVGPLARLNIIKKINTELANEELKIFKSLNGLKPVKQSFYYHYARLIEILYCIERVEQILNDPYILSKDVLVKNRVENQEGIGVIEVPRGTLIHHYWVDEEER